MRLTKGAEVSSLMGIILNRFKIFRNNNAPIAASHYVDGTFSSTLLPYTPHALLYCCVNCFYSAAVMYALLQYVFSHEARVMPDQHPFLFSIFPHVDISGSHRPTCIMQMRRCALWLRCVLPVSPCRGAWVTMVICVTAYLCSVKEGSERHFSPKAILARFCHGQKEILSSPELFLIQLVIKAFFWCSADSKCLHWIL